MWIEGLLLISLGAGFVGQMHPSQSRENVQVEADSQEQNTRAYIELIRADIRAQKNHIIADVMALDDKEAAAFWPLYREYDTAFSSLMDEKLAIIQDYSASYLKMTDEKADQLAKRMLDLEQKKVELRKDYYQKFKKALSPLLAARFTQVMDQIEKLLDLQVDSRLPIIQETESH
jgi:hypothetical protein